MMRKRIERFSGARLRRHEDGSRAFLLLALFFLGGCFAGSVFGVSSLPAALLSDYPGNDRLQSQPFWMSFLEFSRFHIFAFLLGSTYYGVILVPLLSLLRGYAFSRTAAGLLAGGTGGGVLSTLAALGLPAVFSLSCFFLLTQDALFSSRHLLGLVRARPAPRPERKLLHAILCVPLLLCGCLAQIYLVPKLVSLLH